MSKQNHTSESAIEKALNEMNSNGYQNSELVTDGKIHRFGQKKSQWYIAFENRSQTTGDTLCTVVYGDWRTGEKLTYNCKDVNCSSEDRADIKIRIDKAREEAEKSKAELWEETAVECENMWNGLSGEGATPYLSRKNIDALHGARILGDDLYIPLRDSNGKLWSTQKISPNGDKFFEKGGRVGGCFHLMGEIESSDLIYICEGFATAASVYQAIGKPTVVSFNAGNLLPVGQALREKYSDKEFIFAADDDRWAKKPDGTSINPGKLKAKKAAKECGGRVILPKFQDLSTRPSDFNDLHCLEGLEEVLNQLQMEPSETEAKERPSQSKILIDLCREVEFFHTPDDEAYGTMTVGNHCETWAVKSGGFRKWLLRQFYLKGRSAPSAQAMQDALGVLASKATFDGELKNVFIRIAESDGKVYLDLTNDEWEVIEISGQGWKILKNYHVKFRRAKGMLPLARPVEVQDSARAVIDFREFLNLENDEDFQLVTGWLVNTFSPRGPYLVLVLYGEQGSAKSTTVKILRALIDPNIAPLRREPRNAEDLMISAKNNWTIAIDNMSYLRDDLSDDFCRLATEGGLSKRQLFTDEDEIILNAKRPIILNGIDEFVARGDLAGRSIILNLPTISEEQRQREKLFWQKFKENQPRFLGMLLNSISAAIANENSFQIQKQSRMADAWHWVSSAETEFGWKRGSIIKAFRNNQVSAIDVILNSSPIFPFIRILAKSCWSGTAEDLLDKIKSMRGDGLDQTDKNFPKNTRALTNRIRRINPALRIAGIEVDFGKTNGSNSKRIITIRKLQDSCDANDANIEKINDGDEGDAKNNGFSKMD